MSATTSSHENSVQQVCKEFDDALSSRSTAKLNTILGDDVTIHNDGITLDEDITGKPAVTAWLGAYIETISTHEVIASAVDAQAKVAFSFWQDKDAKPVHDTLGGDQPKSGKEGPGSTMGIWHLQLDQAGTVIKHIWFLHQLSTNAAPHKLKESVHKDITFNVEAFKSSTSGYGVERAMRNAEVASLYNNIWKTGDTSAADGILAEDIHQYQPMLGHELVGRVNWKHMIDGFVKCWEKTSQKTHIAVSAGDKAFIWWNSPLIEKKNGKHESMYGLNVLRINEDGKVQTVVGFRQLTGSECA